MSLQIGKVKPQEIFMSKLRTNKLTSH